MDEHELLEFDQEFENSPFLTQSLSDQGAPVNKMGLAQALWHGAGSIVAQALFNPFCLALAQGVLPKSAFQNYIAEDAFFLRSFVKGYAAASKRVNNTTAPSAFEHLNRLRHAVMQELKLHDSYAAEWGVDLTKHTTSSPATTKYIQFLDNICNNPSESAAAILAAMVPCLRLYAYLGCRYARIFPNADHQYVEWIKTYQSNEYVKLPAIAELLLDELAADEPDKGR